MAQAKQGKTPVKTTQPNVKRVSSTKSAPTRSSAAKPTAKKTQQSTSSKKKQSTVKAVPNAAVTTQNPKNKKTNKLTTMQLLKKIAKIDKFPKNVRESVPFIGLMNNGIIETYPGTFTKTYKLQDVNFRIAPPEEQMSIYKHFSDLLNSFGETVKWQFNIFNHEIDKKKTIENIRILPAADGLNKYRTELNTILAENLKSGNNSIAQDKYLTVSIEDNNVDHAVTVLNRLDLEISKRLRRITQCDTRPLTSTERIKLLYDIYNQDVDYRMATGFYNNKEVFDLKFIEKQGLSVKDLIAPPSFDFTKSDYFRCGDMYGQALYLERVPSNLTTNFLEDITDIQANMLVSYSYTTINSEKAVKLVKSKLANIEGKVAAISKRDMEQGYFGTLPPDLERSQENARDLMNDITTRNQNLFFVTFTIIVFARTREQLEENVRLITSVGGKHLCPIKTLKFQQEFALNNSLPLCRNDLFIDRLYTTESASVFIPFDTQEISQKNAIFYGLNQVSKSMVLYDRLSGDNFNGLIFGFSGSGKSFTAKCEIISVLLGKPNSQIFVIDPQGEYYPVANALHGEVINLSPGSGVFINPLDLDISEDSENDPVTMKSDFVLSMLEIIEKNRTLDPICSSIVDRCVRKLYMPYIDELNRTGMTCDVTKCPTLSDLYQELMMLKDETPEAGYLANSLYKYACGSFDTFAHRTNVRTNARLVVYNTKTLGTGLKELGLHICINDIWNRMINNSKRNIYTWFYIDEFHVLLESEKTVLFLKKIWKMARKWLGVPTGIMQNTEDLLMSSETRAIVNNTSFVIMLREPLLDRQNLAELFNLSNAQLEYITESNPGYGLLYTGKISIPFGFDFPKNAELYSIMSTQHDVEDAQFK